MRGAFVRLDVRCSTERVARCVALGCDAGAVFTGHFAGAFAIVIAARRRLPSDAQADAFIANLFVRAGAGRITAEETHAGHAGLARCTVSIS